MDIRLIKDNQKSQYNKLVTHIMQSWEWGEFRKSLGTKVLRFGLYQNNKLTSVFQLTLHPIPFINFNVGYLPKGPKPDKELAEALIKIGKEERCAFIKLEPNIVLPTTNYQIPIAFHPSPKLLFTKYNYILDLTKSEEELLKNMHPKFRYNIKVAQKHGVEILESTDNAVLEDHLKLYFDTTKRQNYHGHNYHYHRQAWKILTEAGLARVLIAYYKPSQTTQKIPLASWMLLNFKDTLYYPFGGSSDQYKNVMASTLLTWEAIKLGKKLGLKKFDLWGAGDLQMGKNDPYFGFTQFKSRLGAELTEYIGTFDLVLNWPIYFLFTFIDKLMPLKIFLLKLVRR